MAVAAADSQSEAAMLRVQQLEAELTAAQAAVAVAAEKDAALTEAVANLDGSPKKGVNGCVPCVDSDHSCLELILSFNDTFSVKSSPLIQINLEALHR